MPYNKVHINLDRSVFTVKYQTSALPSARYNLKMLPVKVQPENVNRVKVQKESTFPRDILLKILIKNTKI